MIHGRAALAAFVIAGVSLLSGGPSLAAASADGGTPPMAPAAHPSGLWLTTPYPIRSADVGDTVSMDLTLTNKGLPPQRVALSLDGLPKGWTAAFVGGGADVGAAIVGDDDATTMTLKLTPPRNAPASTYAFTVVGRTDGETMRLPVSLKLAAAKAAKLTLEPKLPELQGTAATSFDFEADVKNDSLKDTVVNLSAQAPAGFETTFTEGYGSQQIASLPLKAGESKTIKAKVTPPQDAAAGKYQVELAARSAEASATADLALDVTGQPKVAIAGPNDMLSGSATAGQERDFSFTIANTGTKAANHVAVSADVPSGWKAESDPKTIPSLAPDAKQVVSIHLTPSAQAVAGDYMMTVRANGDGASDSADFRVTVETSTLWGATGVGVIAAALLVMAVGVRRYGRR